MGKICYINIQRQITSLIPIIENCISLIEEVDRTKSELNLLPTELESLKEQADFLQARSSQQSELDWQSALQETEFKLDSLVDDLDGILVYLASFQYKLKNIVSLREKLEAIQEERIDGITLERIYKLLKKQPRSLIVSSLQSSNTQKSASKKNQNKIGWSKIFAINDKFRSKKIAITVAFIASLSLGWIVGYYSSTSFKLTEKNVIEKNK